MNVPALALAAAVALLGSAPGRAQPAALSGQVEIAGNVERPVSVTIAALAARATIAVQANLEGGRTATFVGPLLWPLLADAGLVDGPGRGARLQHVFVGRGADGYGAALAIGELDPDFEGKPVIVAVQQDGAPLPQPRLIVPGDRKPGRDVRDLVAIEVR